jgi:hypothetical protein
LPRVRKALARHQHRRQRPEEIPRSQWWEIGLADEKAQGELEAIQKQYEDAKKSLERRFVDKVDKLQRGDEMPPGVMKMVKVFVAVKRKIQPGDKMAGRHGNKGVVSMIVPQGRHAVPRRRDAGRYRAEPAGRAVAHERRADPGDPYGLGLPWSRTCHRAGSGGLQSFRRHDAIGKQLSRRSMAKTRSVS